MIHSCPRWKAFLRHTDAMTSFADVTVSPWSLKCSSWARVGGCGPRKCQGAAGFGHSLFMNCVTSGPMTQSAIVEKLRRKHHHHPSMSSVIVLLGRTRREPAIRFHRAHPAHWQCHAASVLHGLDENEWLAPGVCVEAASCAILMFATSRADTCRL